MSYIGIDIGGTFTKCGLFNNDNLLCKSEVSSKIDHDDYIDSIVNFIKTSYENTGKIKAIGVGIPGFVNMNKNKIILMPNLDKDRINKLLEAITNKYNIPYYLLNDANAGALAENHVGHLKNTKNGLYISMGTGIGGCAIINGHTYFGNLGSAGEYGHMVVVSNGEECTCGKRGCWEAYASSWAVERHYYKLSGKHADIQQLFLFESEGDQFSKIVIEQYLYFLALGLVNLICIFDPETIVFAGGVLKIGDIIIKRIKALLVDLIYSDIFKINFKLAKEVTNAGIIGGALFAQEQFLISSNSSVRHKCNDNQA